MEKYAHIFRYYNIDCINLIYKLQEKFWVEI